MAQELKTATGADTWVCPAGVYRVYVEAWGGGGNGQDGGGTPSGGANAGGGGGGAYSAGFVNVIPGKSYSYSIGSAAQDSYFVDISTILAKGGTSGSGNLGQPGGQASSGVGTVKYSGGNGANPGPGPGGPGGGGAGKDGNGVNGQDLGGGTGGAGNNGSGGSGGSASGGAGTSNEEGGGGGGGGDNNAGGGNGGAPAGGGGGGEDFGGTGARGQIRLTYETEFHKFFQVL